ncbi:hypothetical protein ACWEPA_03020 [Streptomyces filamentosus]|uniref:hypothetical protein n=1 Tax=Streptomyces filamentosus TaxID=67294 RepID=UPI0037D4DF8D
MTEQSVPEAPIDLPIDDWLYEARPVRGCRKCSDAMRELRQAENAGDDARRFEAARQVRSHPHRLGR